MKEKDIPERFSLSRWSRRKLDAKAEVAAAPTAPPAPASVSPASAVPSMPAAPAPELPHVDSLTFDSDFTAFLRPEVDETLKRAALKQLFRHPRFNVMDGLDVYIDDYTKADPIPPEVLKNMLQRFAAVAPPSATSSAESAESESTGAVAAPVASETLPPTATASEASSSESKSPELPESAPDPSAAPRSPL